MKLVAKQIISYSNTRYEISTVIWINLSCISKLHQFECRVQRLPSVHHWLPPHLQHRPNALRAVHWGHYVCLADGHAGVRHRLQHVRRVQQRQSGTASTNNICYVTNTCVLRSQKHSECPAQKIPRSRKDSNCIFSYDYATCNQFNVKISIHFLSKVSCGPKLS